MLVSSTFYPPACPNVSSYKKNISHLASDGNLFERFEANRALLGVVVVKYDGNGGLGHTCLATLVNEILYVACSYLFNDGEYEVRLAGCFSRS